jgi:guanosine-3',5'-bis(diphosphate) 3'-pyrophosphohydrolase
MNSVELARNFALEGHADQKYGASPYIVHLDSVFALVGHLGQEEGVWSYLHDLLEDVPRTEHEYQYWAKRIKDSFGQRILTGCELLRDEQGRNRRERKALTNEKLKRVKSDFNGVLAVKMADRLGNVRRCVEERDSRFEMYLREHPNFRESVYRRGLCEDLQKELDSLLITESDNN